MAQRDYLRRLDSDEYRETAIVHWTMTVRDRRTGWLDARFYYHFRELLTHTQYRDAIACPVFCLMPDHMHLVWQGIQEWSDQRRAMKHLRTRLNASLSTIGFELQDQPYDHVLHEDERRPAAFRDLCEYVARNPERAELIRVDGYSDYPFTGCMVPGYPELKPFAPDYWERYDRTVSWLRKNGAATGAGAAEAP